jgi:hypothetical protein
MFLTSLPLVVLAKWRQANVGEQSPKSWLVMQVA